MRVLLKISFVGTAYHGWQVQPNGVTVQEVLQNSLENLYQVRPGVTGCSRTDAGVHAREFYCHYDIDKMIPPDNIVAALNTTLPNDISVVACKYGLVYDEDFETEELNVEDYLYHEKDEK